MRAFALFKVIISTDNYTVLRIQKCTLQLFIQQIIIKSIKIFSHLQQLVYNAKYKSPTLFYKSQKFLNILLASLEIKFKRYFISYITLHLFLYTTLNDPWKKRFPIFHLRMINILKCDLLLSLILHMENEITNQSICKKEGEIAKKKGRALFNQGEGTFLKLFLIMYFY